MYREHMRAGVEVSVIGLGGHEFLPDGRSRGFSEDGAAAVTPGYIFPGFGGEKRRSVLGAAFEAGINFFDVTIDSEKEAMGRNLGEMRIPYEIYIQTRPEGMVYGYDPQNRKMANHGLLKAEVQRAIKLLKRERIDFYNFAFMKDALDNDPEYLAKIAENVAQLKKEGLIRFAVADTFSGEATYLRQIETGCFDSIFVNFNLADDGPAGRVLPAAQAMGMGVHAREAFGKGAIFKMGDEAGRDRDTVAKMAMRWVLSHPQVTTVVVGMDTDTMLRQNLEVLPSLQMDASDEALAGAIRETAVYQQVHERTRVFAKG